MALTYEQIQAAAKKKGISQENVDKFAAMKWVKSPTPPTPTYKTVDESLIVSNAGQQWLQPWYARRKSPTVATPEDPVKNFNVGALVYDETNPEDYLLKLKAKTATGKSPTEQEIYQWYVAEKAFADMQKAKVATDPFADKQTALEERLAAAQSTELSSDAKALEEYKKSLEAQYESSRQELLASGARQKEAAQQVFSFSWFGRSSDAAQTAVDIQQKTDGAINNLNLAMQAEIALKEAELAGSDGDTLSAINEEISAYRKAAQDWQIEALKSTQDANAKGGASYMDAIMNLAAAATKSGIELGDAKNIQEMAGLARNADWSINEDFVASLPEDIQAIIRSAAMTSQGGNWEKPIIENMWTAKSPKWMQWDGKDWKPITAAQAASGWGWSGWFSWPYKKTATGNSTIWAIDDLLADPNLKIAVWPSLRKIWQNLAFWEAQGKVADFQLKVDNFINQQVLPNLKLLKWAMSDKDIKFIQTAVAPLNTNMSEEWFRQALRNARAVLNWEAYVNDNWVLVKWARPSYMWEETKKTYKQTATWPNWQKMGSDDWVNREVIK